MGEGGPPQVTVGAAFMSQTIALKNSATVKFEIWDTAGQVSLGGGEGRGESRAEQSRRECVDG